MTVMHLSVFSHVLPQKMQNKQIWQQIDIPRQNYAKGNNFFVTNYTLMKLHMQAFQQHVWKN